MKQLTHRKIQPKRLIAAMVFVAGIGVTASGIYNYTTPNTLHLANIDNLRTRAAWSDMLLVESRSELAGCRKEKKTELAFICEIKTKEKIRALEAENDQTKATIRRAEIESAPFPLPMVAVFFGAVLIGLGPIIRLWPNASRNAKQNDEVGHS